MSSFTITFASLTLRGLFYFRLTYYLFWKLLEVATIFDWFSDYINNIFKYSSF